LGPVFRVKEPVLQAVGREKADSDLELDREFTGTSTRNTPGNRPGNAVKGRFFGSFLRVFFDFRPRN
jgi:hypothetical protein